MQCHHVDPTSPRLFKALKVSSRYSCHPSDGKPDKRPQTFMKCQFYWHEELECLVKVTENRRYRRETAAGNSNGASQVVLNHTTIIKTLTIFNTLRPSSCFWNLMQGFFCFFLIKVENFKLKKKKVKKSFSLNKRSSRNLGLLILYPANEHNVVCRWR